jgi:hypothetical protein
MGTLYGTDTSYLTLHAYIQGCVGASLRGATDNLPNEAICPGCQTAGSS